MTEPKDAFAARLRLPLRDVSPIFTSNARTKAALAAVLGQASSAQKAKGATIALADYFSIARACAAASLEESLGLAARPLVSGTTDFVMAQAPSRGTLQTAMRGIARAYNRVHGGEYNFIEITDQSIAYRIDDTGFPYTSSNARAITLMLECVLIYLHSALCLIVGETIAPLAVATRRASRTAHDPLAFWSCPVACAAPAYALAYPVKLAKRTIAGAPPSEESIYKRVQTLIERRETEIWPQAAFAASVREQLRDGARDQEDAARRLGCGVATLRRKLAAEGQSFRALRRDFLNETAKLRLLQAPRIADVADDLGFSDCRSFTRAFKAWNGSGPRAYRAALKSVR